MGKLTRRTVTTRPHTPAGSHHHRLTRGTGEHPLTAPQVDDHALPERAVGEVQLAPRGDRGVAHDALHLTGNVDEWVNSEENKGKSKWAGLKGGAWGHVRNATAAFLDQFFGIPDGL